MAFFRTIALALLAFALAVAPPAHALTVKDATGTTQTVATIGGGYLASGKTAVTGTLTATGATAAFAPLAGRQFNVSLWGTFAGRVALERSFDSGVTWLPVISAWTAPASEKVQEDEVGVQYRLNCTSYTSGTINLRISQ